VGCVFGTLAVLSELHVTGGSPRWCSQSSPFALLRAGHNALYFLQVAFAGTVAFLTEIFAVSICLPTSVEQAGRTSANLRCLTVS
jgi:hypothetical protein